MFTIGLTLEKEAFRIAILRKEKKSIAIESLHTFLYGPDNVKLFYNLPPFHTGKEVQIVSGLTSAEIFIRKLHLPLREKRKILAALPFQLESLIPFSNETPIVCPLLKPLSKQMTAVTVIATTEAHLSSHIAWLKGVDIKPDTISCSPMALVRFARWQFPREDRILCFDVRDQKISCILAEGSELVLSQTIPFGASFTFPVSFRPSERHPSAATFSSEIADAIPSSKIAASGASRSAEILSGKVNEAPFGEREVVTLELEKFSIFLKQKGAVDEQTPWLLTGDSSHFKEILSQLFSGQGLELPETDLGRYAAPIGLALDAIAADEGSVQFCQKEFTPEHTLQFRKKKALHYLGICLGAALLMSMGGSLLLNKKQRMLTENLQNYLLLSGSEGFLSTPLQIQEKLFEWEESLRGKKNAFALLPTVPKVSDVLAWLSTHPAFATEEGGQREGIEIKSLHYSLMKYPKIGDTASPYTAQMDLEFSSSMPRSARDFHEALLKGDQIVNAKKEIKWQTQNQTYHTSFELNRGVGS
jgi:type IV pilus assembly protein PilM